MTRTAEVFAMNELFAMNKISPAQRERILECLREGRSLRAIEAETGHRRETIGRYGRDAASYTPQPTRPKETLGSGVAPSRLLAGAPRPARTVHAGVKTLILGGTTFLGRHLARALVERGHETAMFTRGRRRGDETLAAVRYVGDRDGGLGAIPREGWEAVIDTSGYLPAIVASSCAHLASAGRYLFTSSTSVYDRRASILGDAYAPYTPRVADRPTTIPKTTDPQKNAQRTSFAPSSMIGRSWCAQPGISPKREREILAAWNAGTH